MVMEKMNGRAIWRFIQLVVLVVIFATWWSFWLTSCGTKVESADRQISKSQSWTRLDDRMLESGLYRYADKEIGVICWVYESYGSGGIFCLPVSEVEK